MATRAPKTDLAVKPSSNVVSIRDTLRAQAEALSDRIAVGTGNRIRTANKEFTFPDGGKSPGPIQLTIVDFVHARRYYPEAWRKDENKPPVCFTTQADPKNMVPSAKSPEPQAKDCATCPMNQWGSDGAGKACQDLRFMAVLPPGAKAGDPLLKLQTTKTTSKLFDAHVMRIRNTHHLPPAGVVSTIGLNEELTYPALVFHDDPTPLDDDAAGLMLSRQAEARPMLLQDPDVSDYVANSKAAGRGAVKGGSTVRR